MNTCYEFFVGGYAKPGEAGVQKCRFDAGVGRFETLASNDELLNPSWLLRHPALPVLYAVEEDKPEGRLAALDLSGGGIRRLAALSTGGADPCHICISPDRRHLLAANYTGGSLAAFALDERGLPAEMTELRRHVLPEGAGGNPLRQEAAHVHFSAFHEGRVYVCDLGRNQVLIYGWDAAAGRLSRDAETIEFPEGSGPRHLTFSPDGERLYALCELTARVYVFGRDGAGRWWPLQDVSTASEGFADFERYDWSAAAAIRFAGADTLIASTRGDDTLALFRVRGDGRLEDRRILPARGATPRDFEVFGEWVMVACQGSDRIVALRRDGGDCATMPAIKPTCVAR